MDEAKQTRACGRVPWYLWCAAAAVTSATIGAYWDVSWHRSIGRDTFWTAPHMAIQMCGILAAICCGYLILANTFGSGKAMSSGSVRVWGFRAPLGAFLASWGGAAMLTSVPFDNWWHEAYGLDVKIVSPPHAVLMMGTWAVSAGVMLLIASATNQAREAGQEGALFGRLQRLMLYVGGVMMAQQTFFLSEYTWDTHLHSAGAYKAAALGVPLISAMMWKATRHRWASTWMATIYAAMIIGLILVLPLFPAQPKLGPVYQAVTHFIPPKFPLLLIVPAVAMDLLWSRVRSWKPWLLALATGPLFVATLAGVEYPFADFLMSKASENRFFGTMYHDFATPSWAYDVQRRFMDPQHGLVLFKGLAEAAVIAAVSAWLGIMLGQWMARVRR
jgi:hypothetical protein